MFTETSVLSVLPYKVMYGSSILCSSTLGGQKNKICAHMVVHLHSWPYLSLSKWRQFMELQSFESVFINPNKIQSTYIDYLLDVPLNQCGFAYYKHFSFNNHILKNTITINTDNEKSCKDKVC